MIAPASVKTVFSGKHYNRCVRAHKLVFEAMQRLCLLAFYESLQGSESEKLGVIGDKLLAHFDENMAQLISVDQDFMSWNTAYECFVQKRSEESPTLLLLFIRATRTSDWNLHLSTLRTMIPWFFVTDRVNYSRYTPCYWLEMSLLEHTHPCEYEYIVYFHLYNFIFSIILDPLNMGFNS